MILKKIISGGQNGVDLAGLITAKKFSIATGGSLPLGWTTQDGPKPEYAELYGCVEHPSPLYPPRTFLNVKESSGTIRIATHMTSAGEKCTLKGIMQYGRPYFDVHVRDVAIFNLPEEYHPKTAAQWIIDNNIEILNIAGNSEKTSPGIGIFAERYIEAVIKILRNPNEFL